MLESSVSGSTLSVGARNKWVGDLANYAGLNVSADTLKAMQDICSARSSVDGQYTVAVRDTDSAALFRLSVVHFGTSDELWTLGVGMPIVAALG